MPRSQIHQLSQLAPDRLEHVREAMRARGALPEPMPAREARLLCGCPMEEARYATELCTHDSGADHTQNCVQWCRRCSEGGR